MGLAMNPAAKNGLMPAFRIGTDGTMRYEMELELAGVNPLLPEELSHFSWKSIFPPTLRLALTPEQFV